MAIFATHSYCRPKINGWLSYSKIWSLITCCICSPICTKSTAIFVEQTTELSARLTRKNSLACCHLTHLCEADLSMSSMLWEIKLCVAPESTIADVFWNPTNSSKIKSLLEVFLVMFAILFIQVIFAIANALCSAPAHYLVCVVPYFSFLARMYSWPCLLHCFSQTAHLYRHLSSVCHIVCQS